MLRYNGRALWSEFGVDMAKRLKDVKEIKIERLSRIARDVSNIGHVGTGDVEIRISSQQDIEIAETFLEMAYQKVGG